MKLNEPPGAIIPLSQTPESLVDVCNPVVLLFQVTIVPTFTFSVVGLNVKVPLLFVMIVMVTLGGGVGVGEGVGCDGLVGVGVGLDDIAVGTGVACDGVVGADVGVEPALVGVSVGTSEIKAYVGVGVGLLFVLPLLPPHAANRVRITSSRRQNQVSLA